MRIIGHRGTTDTPVPENSLAAVELALLDGADGVEVDVRLTADGVPVCHHDQNLRRTAGDPRSVAAMTYAELSSVGSFRVPLLSEVVDLVEGRGQLIVDVKTKAWPATAAGDLVEAIAAVLRRHRPSDVTVSSFDRPRILQLRGHDLSVRTALLGRPCVPLGVILRRALHDGHDEAHPHLSSLLAAPELIAGAIRSGLQLTGWAVNEPADLRSLSAAGLPAVITDDPRAARQALQPIRVVA